LYASSPDLPLAWLSRDEKDNDPERFLTALITVDGDNGCMEIKRES
jgi:hypothetical protein